MLGSPFFLKYEVLIIMALLGKVLATLSLSVIIQSDRSLTVHMCLFTLLFIVPFSSSGNAAEFEDFVSPAKA